ncbi:3-ketoacyl-CoA synthase 17-like [Silene latifolia]|uniref:3-ketoacyl-CoA synthase 17-like n=1 Tax=Silene latifolia TaxID=37657 RepID=UPI003D76E554
MLIDLLFQKPVKMYLYQSLNMTNITSIIILMLPIIIFLLNTIFNSMKPRKAVYLVNHASFKPKKSQQMSRQKSISMIKPLGPNFTDETAKLLKKMVLTSGFGDATYAPEAYMTIPHDFSLDNARKEAEAAIFTTIEAVLANTGVKAKDIGVLVVNCSIFNPVPSLTSMVVNKFKLKENVKSFSLSGMGCSAGLAAIDLAHDLLQVYKDTYAMIVSTEILTQAMYFGNEPSKQPINCLFRVGGSAILLSNNSSDRHVSKYQLVHSVRTNTSSSNSSYKCIHLEEDSIGLRGVNLTKDLLVEARTAIKANLSALGYSILPLSEKIMFCFDYLMNRVRLSKKSSEPRGVPNFGRVIEHFVCHVGGKIVIDALEKTVKLDVEPARMTLHRFGNTSSSSVWYGLAYIEAKRKVKKSDRVWQVAFGSGFKCNSVIWRALKEVDPDMDNPWNEDIHLYPIKEDFQAYPYAFEQPK